MSEVALRKVGTSFVATIPAELVQQLKLVEGQKLAVGKENGRIVLTPVTAEMDAVARAYARVARARIDSLAERLADPWRTTFLTAVPENVALRDLATRL